MSSTNKTAHLGLNSWLGSDKPQREDFNRDNSLIDNAVSTHTADASIHILPAERDRWDTPFAIGTYFGNGSNVRTVTLECDFDPTWGIVFAASKVPDLADFTNKAQYHYFALFTDRGSMSGTQLSGKTLTVNQSAVAVFGNEYRSFNENGATYVYIVFR